MKTKYISLVIIFMTVMISLIGVATPASAQSVCSPATAISVPFAKDGTGTFCYQATSVCSYINSWNLTSLSINGTNYTNIWVSGPSIPPLNGTFTITYNSPVAWGHFEIGGPCSGGGATPTNTVAASNTATRTPTQIVGASNTPGGPTATRTLTRTPTRTMTAGPTQTRTLTATPTSNGTNPSAGCGKTRTLQNGTITIQSNGTRQYILRVPDNYSNTRAYRLIVAYHWLNGSAQEVANGGSWASETPYYGLWNLANNSTIFVAPVGLNAGWANTNGQDVTFTDAIISQLKSELCVDQSRIFATGFSYGAGMSYAIACARANVFRGVALYAGAQLSGCSGGTTRIAYFAIHGLSDSVLGISSGRSLRDRYVSVNGVTPQNPPEPAVGSGTHICTTYQGGSPSYPVTWCAFDGDHNPNPHDRGQGTSWVPQQVWNYIIQF
jgi:poly(3-hydroxybutyrate) depolymerase